MYDTKWINFEIKGSMIAEFVNISGFSGNIYSGYDNAEKNKLTDGLVRFKGLAAIAVDQYTCCNEDCKATKTQLRIEGLIPHEFDSGLECVEAHIYARSSMNTPGGCNGDKFISLQSWSGRRTGVICGKSIEVRFTPPPPGYSNHVREGQSLNTWAKDLMEPAINIIDEYPCPYCVKRAMEKNLVDGRDAAVIELIKNGC